MRVHELAKELDITVPELKEHLQDLDISVSGNFAHLTDEQVAQVKDYIGFGDDTPAPPMEAFEALLSDDEKRASATASGKCCLRNSTTQPMEQRQRLSR